MALSVRYGSIVLRRFISALLLDRDVTKVPLNGRALRYASRNESVTLAEPAQPEAGNVLRIESAECDAPD